MKNCFYFLLLTSYLSFSQTVSINAEERSETNFEKALKDLDEIRFYDFNFINDNGIKSLRYSVILTEIVDGKEVKQSKFIESNPSFPMGNFENNKLPVSIISKSDEDKFKLLFKISKSLNYKRTFDLKKEDQFDFKMFVNPKSKFEINKKYLLCAIVKPIKIAEDTYRNCDFNSEIDNYKDWFEIFGLNKYFIFEIIFED